MQAKLNLGNASPEWLNPYANAPALRKIRVAVVEDDEETLARLAGWIKDSSHSECVCLCRSAAETLERIPRLAPDVVLMRNRAPDESGIACTLQLKAQLPNLKVIVLSICTDHDRIVRALRAGASGYLTESATRQEILNGIILVQAGGAPMAPLIVQRIVEVFHQTPLDASETDPLSPREDEVMQNLSRGLSNKQIAQELGISCETVCVHLRRIYKKLRVQCRTEAVLRYLKREMPIPAPVHR